MSSGDQTKGIVRAKAFETESLLFARSRVPGGVVSGWHHHGKRDVYAFLLSGRLRFDFGENGKDSVEAVEGDYIHIPVGLVHRDVNPDQDREAVIVNVFIGGGPPVVNVPGP